MKKHTNQKSAEQKAHEDVIVLWCAIVFIAIAVCAGLAGRGNDAINHNASRGAVDQVEVGK